MANLLDPIMRQRQLSEINKALSKAAEVEAELDKLETCGADCQQRRETVHEQRTILNAFKRTYFPDAM